MRLRPPVPRPIPPRLSRLSCSLLGCSLLASGAAWAADEAAPASELRGAGLRSPAQSCRASRPNHPPRVTALEPATARDDPRLWVESDQITGQISQAMRAEGHVQLQRGVLALTADQLDYTAAQNRVHATGRVQLWRDQDYFAGSELDLDTERVEGQFVAPRYWFDRTQAGGRAERLDFLGKNQFAVLGATYSSCDVADGETPAWELTARRVRIDMDANEGVAEGGVLRFQGVPILAWPLLSFPVTDERKSGWLPPQISVASTSGFEFGVPYYWNIAPNLDATVTPVVSLKRGGSMDGEFRYLGDHEQGALHGSWLPRDQLTKTSRWALGSEQRGDLAAQWSYDWRALRVSDNDHWKDGLRGAESLTPRLLNSQAQLRQRSTLDSEWLGEVDQWLYARAQRWQVLQSTLASDAITAPYQRSPQVGALWRGQSVQGPSWSLQTEANRFTRVQDGELTGSRAHLIGELNWPWVMGGWSLTPRLGVNAAAYDTVEAMSDGRHQAGRVIPTVSLDSAWLLDRPTEWFGHSLTQTLEPRLIYARTPWRDLSRTPNFDSARLRL
ncbi:MAG: LPS-assembly protein LptD, partial [Leptothrix sp. (in: b-proteobacteria)]